MWDKESEGWESEYTPDPLTGEWGRWEAYKPFDKFYKFNPNTHKFELFWYVDCDNDSMAAEVMICLSTGR